VSVPPIGQIDIAKTMTEHLTMHQNVKQELVVTTVDKLTLCLIEHEKTLQSRKEWMAPAGLLVSLVTTLVAADFHAALGIPTDSWRAIYIMGTVVSALATVLLGVRAIRSLRRGGLEQLVDRIADRARSGTGGSASSAYSNAIVEMFRAFF
jgi:hypothetical protein